MKLTALLLLSLLLVACGTGGYWDSNDEYHNGPYFIPRPNKQDDRIMISIIITIGAICYVLSKRTTLRST